MKGLLLKDFYNIRGVLKTYGAILICLFVFCFVTKKEVIIGIIPVLILSTLITTTFRVDNRVCWSKYVTVLPVKKNTVIMSKYILLVLLTIIGSLLGIILSLPYLFIESGKLAVVEQVVLMGISISLCSGTSLIIVNCLIEESSEKLELFTIVAYMISAVVVMGGYKAVSSIIRIKGVLGWGVFCMIILALSICAEQILSVYYSYSSERLKSERLINRGLKKPRR
ncbi:ABC-2 transporter permease [Anaerocolumna sp. MB42-C2]|uniref:ABC-2 transporter permease n=1 Tax=Anaerocolumna sp. MB42-C2 TaxID=3070997 RepID=UPI0027E0AA3D|nr:ABC-2 transporter permease [Anaerocolumna sp. MB42-C2]WMJ87375.1 ABC-2 transporter permease [Anaerocolumna sp. MB42-C2]